MSEQLAFFPESTSSAAASPVRMSAALAGERSGLWFAFRDVVRALGPGVVVVENVASGARRWLCRVRSDLHALGYGTTAYAVSAASVGAPHRRERIFVVAHAGDHDRDVWTEARGDQQAAPVSGPMADAIGDGRYIGPGARGDGAGSTEPADRGGVGDPEREGQQGPEHESGAPRGGLPTWTGRQRGQALRGVGGEPDGLPPGVDRRIPERWPSGRGEAQASWEPPRTVTGRVPDRRARLRALGNAVVPHQAREVGREILARGLL